MSHVSAAMAKNMMQTPTGQFSLQWPEPQLFPQFLFEMGKVMSEDYDWSQDVAQLPMPVLLVFANNNSISQKHVAEFFALLGGGVKEAGWLNMQLSRSRLAVVPGYSHYNFLTSPEVPQILDNSSPIRSLIHRRRSSRLAGPTGAGEEAVTLRWW